MLRSHPVKHDFTTGPLSVQSTIMMRKQVKMIFLHQNTFSVLLVTFFLGFILADVAPGHPGRYVVPGSEVDGPDDDVRLPAAAVVVVLPTVRLRFTCSHKGVTKTFVVHNIRSLLLAHCPCC